MPKIPNPYRKGSQLWALMAEDWSDLTGIEIAEVFNTTPHSVYSLITKIKRETGYTVPYNRQSHKQTG